MQGLDGLEVIRFIEKSDTNNATFIFSLMFCALFPVMIGLAIKCFIEEMNLLASLCIAISCICAVNVIFNIANKKDTYTIIEVIPVKESYSIDLDIYEIIGSDGKIIKLKENNQNTK